MALTGSAGFRETLNTVFRTATAPNKRSKQSIQGKPLFSLVRNHGLFRAIEGATSRKIPVFRDAIANLMKVNGFSRRRERCEPANHNHPRSGGAANSRGRRHRR